MARRNQFSALVVSALLPVVFAVLGGSTPSTAKPPVFVLQKKAAGRAIPLLSAKQDELPRALVSAVKSTGRANRITGFVRKAVDRRINAKQFVLAAEPDQREAALANAQAALTEPEVEEFVRAAAKSLSGAIPPGNLRLEAFKQNAVAARSLHVESLQAVETTPVKNLITGEALSPKLARFDWRDRGWVVKGSGIVTKARNQSVPASCGCCWAFATVGTLEAAYAKTRRRLIDGSEQNMLDCYATKIGVLPGVPFDCRGGWFAYDLLVGSGLAREADYPYTGVKGVCNDQKSRPYKAVTWGYVTDSNHVPSPEEIKDALCRYGPLSVAIFASTFAFGSHDGDLPVKDFPNGQRGPGSTGFIDHAIMIVGWNDKLKAWAIKNSWGEDWGDQGFGYVDYGSNNVGWGASWVKVDAGGAALTSERPGRFDLGPADLPVPTITEGDSVLEPIIAKPVPKPPAPSAPASLGAQPPK